LALTRKVGSETERTSIREEEQGRGEGRVVMYPFLIEDGKKGAGYDEQ